MDDRLKQTLLEEASHAQAVAHEVAVSGAYLYPLKVSERDIESMTTLTILARNSIPHTKPQSKHRVSSTL
jgi:hypothetical protein